MGIVAYGANNALNMLAAKQHHMEDENFSSIQENDIIHIKVIGVRKEYQDSQISIIGKLVYNVKKDTKPQEEKKENLVNYQDSYQEPEPEPEPEPERNRKRNSIKFTNKSKAYKFMTMHNNNNEFNYKDVLYKTIEHAYQAQKSTIVIIEIYLILTI